MCQVPRSSVERPRSLDEHRSERMASAEFRGPQYDLGWTSRPRRSPVNVSAKKCRPVDTFGAWMPRSRALAWSVASLA